MKIIIEDFMTQSLKLSGNELVLFAIFWRESNGGKNEVKLDYTRFPTDMGVSLPTLYNCLRKLVERGYIVEKYKGVYVVDEICKR